MNFVCKIRTVTLKIAAAACCLAIIAAPGCGTTGSSSAVQPYRVVVMQANAADYKQIKDGLESALKALEQGDRESFLAGMDKVRENTVRFLGRSSKFKVSDETIYQFLADRLKDAPAYAKTYSAAALAKMVAQTRSAECAWANLGSGAAGDLNGSLSPDSVKNVLEAMLSEWGETAFAVDDTLVRHVTYFVKFYALCDTEKTNRAVERSRKYMPYIRDVFARQNLHEDIAFAVPFVESRFTTAACSTAGALGMFQFMPHTATEYGMQIDAKGRDDRLDWEKEAPAAARYLVKSRNVFGSSVLALGAYHHGSMKVVQVLLAVAERSKTRSFSPIFNHGELEPYSREYIPQCLAAAYLYRYMNQAHLDKLPETGVRYENIKEALPVAKLSLRYKELVAHNQDLTHADRIYCYASTGGYALITDSTSCDIKPARLENPAEKNQGESKSSDADINLSPVSCTTNEEALGKTADKPGASGTAGQDDAYCKIIYTFQKGNSLPELARTFGVDLLTILDDPVNRRWKERYPRNPRPGDIVVIPRLAPTTTLVSSAQSSPGAGYRFYTAKDQTLREIAETVTDAFESSGADDSETRCIGKNLTPELILYWNRDHLPRGAGVEDPLPAGIPLFIVSDFR